jgi:DNA-binding LacI/PurR family transcriptional regulator
MNADGIIIASTNEAIKEYLAMCQIPVVAIDSLFDTKRVQAYVYSDYYTGGRMAMEHLLECGCRNVVCIQGPQEIFSAKRRYEGYRDVCRERGITEQTVSCDYDFAAGLAMTEELLHTYPEVDGIIACNDIVAISTYKVLHKKGISVPEQVQLIGFDDVDFAQLMSPELTTICQPIEAMARKAADLLIYHTEGEAKRETGREIVFPVSLKIRETTRRREENP